MSRIKFSELSGKDVISQDGREIGQVSDIALDSSGWRIDTLVVKLERDLLEAFHMKKPVFGTQTIQIPTSHVSGVGDKVILHKKLEELTALARESQRMAPAAPRTEARGGATPPSPAPAVEAKGGEK